MIRHNKQSGFAITEAVLLIVLVGLLVGVGLFVSRKNKTTSSSAQTTSKAAPQLDPKKVGTVEGVEIVSQNDISDELKAEDTAAAQEESDALRDATATSSVGEGYNVNF